jgi:hypothetical protein
VTVADDPRTAAARYRAERAALEDAGSSEERTDAARAAPPSAGRPSGRSASSAPASAVSAVDRAAIVETAIQQAIRRGDFDDLPGAGKPIPGLGEHHDPDWWIRRKIESEQLTGLGPPALMLRVENAELEARLDALAREQDVRDALADFNRRVIEARRQLLGGPPVVTPTRDVEVEVRAWQERRATRAPHEEEADAAPRRRRRWRRRRA